MEKDFTTTRRYVNRRKFIQGMAAVGGMGLAAGLVACGDATNTSSPAGAASTTGTSTTVATTAATTAASTTTAATTAAMTTSAATTAAGAASGGDAPAGYTQVGALPTDTTPLSFTSGSVKGYIYAKSADQVMVFSNKCTHQGCAVPYVANDKKFECPCHGSQYDITGEVVKGPAKLRLPLFDSKVIGGMVYAKLS